MRIWGIQAPERHEPGGAAATRAMSRIGGRADLTCQRKGTSYQRVVARCRLPSGQDVAAELVRQGVSRSAITVQAFGESRPLVPTADGVREPQNRRVEIVLK